ncbi:hypothetical protein K227x_54600 [Rubripirellula lacrimiformis]|uniref:Uncharacterized protein n=1 Tax=Rubripirellula lacrimiformis TaxID=1930273 RepID=A0A517NIS3_9BACT|nr:hypothetical protein K227x_54600 [Rubripirellula lacrimiformis]
MVKHSRRLVLRIAQSAEPLWSRVIERLEGRQVTLPKPSVGQDFMPPPEHAHLQEVLRHERHPSTRSTALGRGRCALTDRTNPEINHAGAPNRLVNKSSRIQTLGK